MSSFINVNYIYGIILGFLAFFQVNFLVITAKKTYDVIVTSRAQIFTKLSENITFAYGMTL